jgi:hypothetical protein
MRASEIKLVGAMGAERAESGRAALGSSAV